VTIQHITGNCFAYCWAQDNSPAMWTSALSELAKGDLGLLNEVSWKAIYNGADAIMLSAESAAGAVSTSCWE
jgi:hypothetical protein